MPQSVLVTGGAGFIGRRLCERLAQEGHVVTVLDSLEPRVHPPDQRPPSLAEGITLRVMDVVAAASDWDATLAETRPDVVIHLAADTATARSLREAGRHASTNVLGTANLLDALSRADARPTHVVLTSSRAVYGEGAWQSDGVAFYPRPRTADDLRAGRWNPIGPRGQPVHPLPHHAAKTQPRPSSVYGATKLAQEHVCAAWCAGMDVPLSILRFQNVYGAGQSVTNPYAGIATLFAVTARRGDQIEVYEDGDIVRDFVHVSDAVSALMAAVNTPPERDRVLDIGSGSPVTLLDVAIELARRAGAPAPVVSGAYREGDVRAAAACIEDAKTTLGWRPEVPLAQGIDELLSSVGEGGP
jgi:dTDP-L-rhamnose 4-epimerase